MSTVLLLQDAVQDAKLRAALDRFGHRIIAEVEDARALCNEAVRLTPDVIIVTTRSPSADALAAIGAVTESSPRPVVMFAMNDSREVIRKAVACGVSAYVVDSDGAERVSAIIEAAAARFEAYQAVKEELATTRTKLTERKIIEKAKGIVMKERGLSEDAAYSAMRKMAMDKNLTLAEVARRVISVAELLA